MTTEKKSIIICYNTSWYIYNFRLNLIKELQQVGFQIHTVAPIDEYSAKLQQFGCVHHTLTVDNNKTNPVKDFGTFYQLIKIYRQVKPVVLLHFTVKPNIYGTLAARFLRIECINNVAGLGTAFLTSGILQKIVVFLYRLAFSYRKATVFFQNKDDRQLFYKQKIVKSNRVELLPGSGVDLERFQPVGRARDREFVFLFVGRMIVEKGVTEFLQAAKDMHNRGVFAHFRLIGELDVNNKHSVSGELLRRYHEQKIVDYLGFAEDIHNHLADADCVVLPSYYREGVPRVLLEAAAMAKPVITADTVGCREAVDDQVTGFLCRPRDAIDLAEKMEKMAGLSAKELAKMGAAARKRVEQHFDEKIVLKRYLSIIKEISEQNR